MDDSRQPGERETGTRSSCKGCCERVPWSSVVATTLTVGGVSIVVATVSMSSIQASDLFSNSYIAEAVDSWFSWLEVFTYVGLVLMVALILLLMTMGCMASGYQNAATWCSFSKAQTGRRQLGLFLVLTYTINLSWYVIFIGSTLPTIFFFMLDSGVCTATVFTPSTCLDLRQFGLAPQSLPDAMNQTLICGYELMSICESNLLLYFFLALIGCILVLLGMNHFLMSLAGNYNWLRVRKRRQKLAASRIGRRAGTYDVNSSVFPRPERQESQDSNTHLRPTNLQYGSSSNVLSSSSSIPTLSAQVSAPSSTTLLTSVTSHGAHDSPTSTTPVAKPKAATPSSMQSSRISNRTYGFDDNDIGHLGGLRTRATTVARTVATAERSGASSSPENNPSYDSKSRYDHYNPAFDENYWDPPYTIPQTNNDTYYSRQWNGDVGGYDGWSYNQGYHTYDDTVTDRNATQTSATSSYPQNNSHFRDRSSVGNKFYEYQL